MYFFAQHVYEHVYLYTVDKGTNEYTVVHTYTPM